MDSLFYYRIELVLIDLLIHACFPFSHRMKTHMHLHPVNQFKQVKQRQIADYTPTVTHHLSNSGAAGRTIDDPTR